jgi:nascent polypeptide-associated complex subunit alpha
MQGISQRQAKRMMKRLGMEVKEVHDTKQVIIRTSNKEIVIDNPEVTMTKMHDQKIFQRMGGSVAERGIDREVIPEEDVKLVAQQANVGLEVARKALERAKGDLAQAILLLAQRGSV